MGVAGYNAVLKRSGFETVFTSEAMSTVAGSTETAGKHWSIDDSTKDLFVRTAVVTFTDASSTISSTDILDINYLFGKVIFKSTHPAVNVTGQYFPLSNIAGAHAYTLTQQNDVLDDTDFTSTGFRSKVMGLQTVDLSVTRWDSLDLEFVHDILGTSTGRAPRIPLVAEIQPGGGSNPVARGYFVMEAENRSGDVSGLESADVSLQLEGDDKAAFRWSDQ